MQARWRRQRPLARLRKGEEEIEGGRGSKEGDGAFHAKAELAVVMDGAEEHWSSLFIGGRGRFAGGEYFHHGEDISSRSMCLSLFLSSRPS